MKKKRDRRRWIWMDVIEKAKADFVKYGRNGDNSFECFGVTVENGELAEPRTYRLYNPFSKDWENDMDFHVESFLDRISGSIFRVLDIYEQLSVDGLQHRIIFETDCSIPLNTHKTSMDTFFKKFALVKDVEAINRMETMITNAISPDHSPMRYMGVTVMRDGMVHEVRPYFSLIKDSDDSDIIDENPSFESLEGILRDTFDLMGLSNPVKRFCVDMGRVCSDYQYSPVYIGLTQYKEPSEYKLYFMSQSLLPKEEIISNSTGLLKDLNAAIDLDDCEKFVQDFIEIGLYMKILAIRCSLNHEGLCFKAYFAPLPDVTTKVAPCYLDSVSR
jgi:hypothetical protein